MRTREPMIRTLEISEVETRLPGLVDAVSRKETRILVEQGGTPVAAIVSADDFERLARLDREREERFGVIDRARAAFAGIPPEEIERETDRIIDRNRAADRAADELAAAR